MERVRGLREEAARRELVEANAALVAARQLIATADSDYASLSEAPVPATGGQFAHRALVTAMVAETCQQARQTEAQVAAVAEERTQSWRKARTDQAAIVSLLERRAAARKAEAAAIEQKELDELAGRRIQDAWNSDRAV